MSRCRVKFGEDTAVIPIFPCPDCGGEHEGVLDPSFVDYLGKPTMYRQHNCEGTLKP